ncbi:MAG: hypothetical protein U0736_26125 [Gemmataceae bacterium]
MGLWGTIKGWLNIGGVKVLLWKYKEPLSRSNPVMQGAVLLKTKSDKTVNSVEVKVVEEYTYTEEEDGEKKKKTDTKVLGSIKFPNPADPGLGYPLELKPGQDREQKFSFPVALTQRLQDKKGVLGGIGKLAAFAGGEKVEIYLVAEASVKGAAFNTSDRQKLTIGD